MDEQMLNAIGELLDMKLDPIKKDLEIVAKNLIRLVEKVNIVDEISKDHPGDIINMLHLMDKNLHSIKKDIEFAYQKTSMNELYIDRLKRQ